MLLKTRDLCAGYGRLPVLHDLDFAVEEGEFVAVLGANGAGKSTLLKTLARVLPVMSGDIAFDGRTINGWRATQAARGGIAYVPQERNVFSTLSVNENLRLAAIAGGRRDRIDGVLERLPRLRERLSQRAGTLSGGERQMLAIASALLSDARLLLLDEPTTGLGPQIVEQISTWIDEIARDGMTVVWVVEQNPEPVLRRAGRAYVLEGGQVRVEGKAAAVAERYLSGVLLGDSG